MKTISVANNKIIGVNALSYQEFGKKYPVENIAVSEDIYEKYINDELSCVYKDNLIIENPEYAKQKVKERENEFNKNYFETSLGYVARKVLMETGEIKDFLTDILPVISLGINEGQTMNIITYKMPNFTKENSELETKKDIKQATPEFIKECLLQFNKDYTGILK